MTEVTPPDADTRSRCPRCGDGVLVDVTFEAGSTQGAAGEPIQEADTRQVEVYSCGHQVVGPRLDETATGAGGLEVEHRKSDETAGPA
jgi:uncharacterized protein (DUF983 family)